jgi:hypothetical protein
MQGQNIFGDGKDRNTMGTKSRTYFREDRTEHLKGRKVRAASGE